MVQINFRQALALRDLIRSVHGRMTAIVNYEHDDEAYERKTRDCRERLSPLLNALSSLRDSLALGGGGDEVTLSWPHPNFANEQEVLDWCGYSEIKKPTPRVLVLKKDRNLEVTKYVYKQQAWTKEKEQSLVKSAQTMSKLQRDTDEWLQLREAIAELRRDRRDSDKLYVTYEVKRGPYTASHSGEVETNGLQVLATTYKKLRRQINHARKSLADNARPASGRFGQKVGGTYVSGGMVLQALAERQAREVFGEKKPQNSVNHVGIELEFCAAYNSKQLAGALHAAKLGGHVNLKTDGSLRSSKSGDYTHELCILAKETEYKEVVTKTCEVLRKAGAYVNKSCGMHVHLDMRRRTPEVCYDRLLKSLDILYGMVPSDRRYNRFCQRNASDMRFDPGMPDRYWAVNPCAYNRHKTIEVRLHTGTVLAKRVNYWTQLLLLIVSTPNAIRQTSVPTFVDTFKVPEDLANYMLERTAKFMEIPTDDEHIPDVIERQREGDDEGVSAVCNCESCRSLLLRRARESARARTNAAA